MRISFIFLVILLINFGFCATNEEENVHYYFVEGVGFTFKEAFFDGINKAIIKSGKMATYDYTEFSDEITTTNDGVKRSTSFYHKIFIQAFSQIDDYVIESISKEKNKYKLQMKVCFSNDSAMDFPEIFLEENYNQGEKTIELILQKHNYPGGMWYINKTDFEETTKENFKIYNVNTQISFDLTEYEKLTNELYVLLDNVADCVVIERLRSKPLQEGLLFSELISDSRFPYNIRIIKINDEGKLYTFSFMFRESNEVGKEVWHKLKEYGKRNFELIVRIKFLGDNEILEVNDISVTTEGLTISGLNTGIGVTEQIPGTIIIVPGIINIYKGGFSIYLDSLSFKLKKPLESYDSRTITVRSELIRKVTK